MKTKISFLLGGVLGYLLGARAGRERYEQIVDAGQRVWENPRVQEGRHKVEDAVREQVPVVKERASDAARNAGAAAGAKVSEARSAAQDKVSEVRSGNGDVDGGMGQKKPHLPEPPTA